MDGDSGVKDETKTVDSTCNSKKEDDSNLRKEEEEKKEEKVVAAVTTNGDSVKEDDVTSPTKDGLYFLEQLKNEQKRLLQMADKIEEYMVN